MRKVVGIDRKIKRVWLDKVLDRLAQTTEEAELRAFLDRTLKDELPGKESRAKSVGIILRIWSGVPKERLALRDRAVALLSRISGQERIWLHWGMTSLAYPFFRDAAEVVGRLLALQDDFTTGQVQARLLTSWGDRATSKEAAQKLLTTLVDWELLRSTKTKGHFLLARKMTSGVSELQLWLLETLLGASAADEIEAQQLLRLPESFPFTLNIGVADLRKHEGFDIHRQGLDMDMVGLRKVRVEQPAKPAKKPRKVKTKEAVPAQPDLFNLQGQEGVVDEATLKTVHAASVITPSVNGQPDGVDEQGRVEESIKNEVLGTLPERAARFLQARGMVLVPDGPFAGPSAECVKQFRDGHYYGCVSLTQAVMEAIVRHIWQVKLRKKASQEGAFDKNLEALHKKGFVKDEWKTKLDLMWTNRHTFHHLRPSVESDQRVLEDTARTNLKLLDDLEREFFGYGVRDGFIVPDHPEYWSINEGGTLVFVRDQGV